MKFSRGLVVGKFAPLHRGHELLIRRALELSEKLVILSYANPEPPGSSAERRARWLARLFPEAERLVLAADPSVPLDSADDETHRRFVAERVRAPIDAVFTSEAYGPGFAESLGRHHGRAVVHVSVDPARETVPISASQIRKDVHAHRAWLSPAVYASFVERVALLGGESCGKSTLAAALADRFGTAYVEEFGRTLWTQKAGKLAFEDLLAIAERQIALEDEACERAHRWLFCDSTPLTTLFYSLEMFGRVDAKLERLADRTYDQTVLCAPDFPFVQDGTRREPSFREHGHAWYLRELGRRRTRYLVAQGSVDQRVQDFALKMSHKTSKNS